MNAKTILRMLAALALCGFARGAEPVQIDFFFEPGCHECERIESELLPEIGKRFPGTCVIRSHDIGVETNFLRLLQLERELGYKSPERAYLVVNRQIVFGPVPSHEDFFAVVSNLLKTGSLITEKPVLQSRDMSAQTPDLAKTWYGGFTFPAVIAAGLIDGINPCAISTLVFFMSLLAVSKVRNRQLILLGISFCTASFLTYLGIGFGLFRVLHLFSGFTALRSAVEWIMTAILLVLAVLSFRDAIRFRKTGRAADVTLQLSTGMKKRIHDVMRRGLGSASIIWGGLLIGCAVTALESVCTGQVYVPTLVLVLKDSAFSEFRAWMLLLLYNALFILPLVVVFIAVYFGLRTETLLAWSRRNVVVSKLLLGLFFVLMALVIFCG
jgi:cytochrome c biogenesis protein CcdA